MQTPTQCLCFLHLKHVKNYNRTSQYLFFILYRILRNQSNSVQDHRVVSADREANTAHFSINLFYFYLELKFSFSTDV